VSNVLSEETKKQVIVLASRAGRCGRFRRLPGVVRRETAGDHPPPGKCYLAGRMPLSEWKKLQAVKMPLAKRNKLIADLTARAETDDAQAQWELGSLLDGGLLDRQSESFAVKPNQGAAIFWFRRSAQAGNASGQVSFGNYLAAGRPTKGDEDEGDFMV
jgi:TPR repeat protein